ncbi:carbon-nitrogen hydrolase family protein [Microscilla marina]|uniref:Nitrilase 4 n=1 Tax=Microscilla marina ATCC 23134 TaxID=313606 RepID=A1ZD79_MICM2|nr:carbon-nitrogen hydrolase family protein [Microscilla marina]EAY31618.1 nitrilase 4 [Microscilla marina ATCC 23134]
MSTLDIAVIQAAPVLFDLEQSLDKTYDLLKKATAQGAKMVVFPESFLPAYPRGLSFGTVVGSRTDAGREVWQLYWKNSVKVPGKATNLLAKWAKEYAVYLVMGITEQDTVNGSLYCSLLYFSPEGHLLGKHRKLKPTAAERIIWGEGDATTLQTYPTPYGNIGGLICWENYMPLARMALYQQGIHLYLAPTADARESWQATMQHIALEGRCFVVGCNQFVTKSMYPPHLRELPEMTSQPEVMSRGGSVVLSPLGKVLAGPVFDREEVLLATLDLDDIIKSKLDFDPVGHYSRPDMLNFNISN